MNIKKLTTKEILSNNLARKPHSVLSGTVLFLHNIRSMHNIGSAFRSADAFGIRQIVLSGYSPVPPRPEISKTALGADESVNWQYTEDPVHSLSELKERGYLIAGVEQTHNSVLLPDFTPDTKKICLVLGNEVTGIDDIILPQCDILLEIPQFGQKHSLNVSVSIGIVLYSFLEKIRD